MSPRWLLLRRAGVLWGVPSRTVQAIRRDGAGAVVELAGSTWLQADEVLEMTLELQPRELPTCVATFGVPRLGGVALWGGAPVLLLDAAAPPAALLAAVDGQRTTGAAGAVTRGEV